MITGMSDITERASALAKAHPAHVILENAFLGFFAVIGGIFGYAFRAVSWLLFHGYTLLFVIWLAAQDGFRKTSKIEPKPKKNDAPASVPPLTGMPPTAQQILEDPRYQDQSTTPFGVPYGPNVHASH